MTVRSERVTLMLSAEELETVRENAAWFGIAVPTFLRHVALGGTIDWRDDALRRKAWARRGAVAG